MSKRILLKELGETKTLCSCSPLKPAAEFCVFVSVLGFHQPVYDLTSTQL